MKAKITKRGKVPFTAPASLTLTEEEIKRYTALCDGDAVDHPHNREGHQMRVVYTLICDGCGHQASLECAHDGSSNRFGFCPEC